MMRKSKKAEDPIVNKISPFKLLLDWFYSDENAPIPEEALQLSPVVVLNMFCQTDGATIFLNETVNNFALYGYSRENCLNTFKSIIKLKGITRQQLSYMKSAKEKNEVVEIQNRLPYLKHKEVHQLLLEIDNSSERDSIRESFGLMSVEKSKVKTEKPKSTTPKKRSRKNIEQDA